MGTQIKDNKTYNLEMSKSAYDKLFFVDKIFDPNIEYVIDFGCADGSVTKLIAAYYPKALIIGYDQIYTDTHTIDGIVYTGDIRYISDLVYGKRGILYMSSVMHEIYHYLSCTVRKYIFMLIRHTWKPAYIVIRDMYFRSDRAIELQNFAGKYINNKLEDCIYTDKWHEFQKINGDQETLQNAVHFLLKCRFDANWDREKLEQYFTDWKRDFVEYSMGDDYEVNYERNYLLPYVKYINMTELNIVLTECMCTTHAQVILKRENVL